MERMTSFSQEDLNEIFEVSPKDHERVISRESSTLEFKESFGWKSIPKYLKTCAAYANAKGGYIVFGVANRPHKLIGLKGSNLQSFENIEPEKMTRYFNEHFSPEISWDVQEYVLNGKTYGLLYVYESRQKPVVCIKDAERELKEGDIYYRYRGRSERIKYPELRTILDQSREIEQRMWMQHLAQIAKIGVRDVGIFDIQTGYVTGTSNSFLIDESLLSQLSFIREGEFSEVKGKPALKLIGNVEAIPDSPSAFTRKQIVKIKGIRIGDIVLAFLNQEKVADPLEYVRQICFESTAFLPVYYFIRLGNLNRQLAVELINGVVSRSPAKKKLVARLSQKNTQNLPLRDWKRQFTEQMKQKKIKSELTGKDLEYCLQALRSLTPEEVRNNSLYLRGLLKTWFNKHYSSAQVSLADNLRRAICWVDEALYIERVE